MPEIKIGEKLIAPGCPVLIIAEMSANHGGDFQTAVDIIRSAKEAGADASKIQTYTPDSLTIDCDKEYFKIEKGLCGKDTPFMTFIKRLTLLTNGSLN
jgi:pseudaminic acid synthase